MIQTPQKGACGARPLCQYGNTRPFTLPQDGIAEANFKAQSVVVQRALAAQEVCAILGGSLGTIQHENLQINSPPVFFFTGIRCGVDIAQKPNKSGQILDQRLKIFFVIFTKAIPRRIFFLYCKKFGVDGSGCVVCRKSVDDCAIYFQPTKCNPYVCIKSSEPRLGCSCRPRAFENPLQFGRFMFCID